MSKSSFTPSDADKELMESVLTRLRLVGGLKQSVGTVLRSIPGVRVNYMEMAGMTVAAVFESETERPIATITPNGQIVYVRSHS